MLPEDEVFRALKLFWDSDYTEFMQDVRNVYNRSMESHMDPNLNIRIYIILPHTGTVSLLAVHSQMGFLSCEDLYDDLGIFVIKHPSEFQLQPVIVQHGKLLEVGPVLSMNGMDNVPPGCYQFLCTAIDAADLHRLYLMTNGNKSARTELYEGSNPGPQTESGDAKHLKVVDSSQSCPKGIYAASLPSTGEMSMSKSLEVVRMDDIPEPPLKRKRGTDADAESPKVSLSTKRNAEQKPRKRDTVHQEKFREALRILRPYCPYKPVTHTQEASHIFPITAKYDDEWKQFCERHDRSLTLPSDDSRMAHLEVTGRDVEQIDTRWCLDNGMFIDSSVHSLTDSYRLSIKVNAGNRIVKFGISHDISWNTHAIFPATTPDTNILRWHYDKCVVQFMQAAAGPAVLDVDVDDEDLETPPDVAEKEKT